MILYSGRFLWVSIVGLVLALTLLVVAQAVVLAVLLSVDTGLQTNVMLNQQANRTTTMRQDTAEYVDHPTPASATKLAFDYNAWEKAQTALTLNLKQYDPAIQQPLSLTIAPEAGIQQWIDIITTAKPGEPLQSYYVNMVVYVGEYNIAINSAASAALNQEIVTIHSAILTTVLLCLVIIGILILQYFYAVLPAYNELKIGELEVKRIVTGQLESTQ